MGKAVMLLVAATALLFLCGLTLLISGIVLLTIAGWLYKEPRELLNNIEFNKFPVGTAGLVVSVIMMATGAVSCVITIIGLCAAKKKGRSLLICYVASMVFLALLHVAAIAIWAMIVRNSDDWLSGQMLRLLKTYQGPTVTDHKITDGWNHLFIELRCCGVNDQYSDGSVNDFSDIPTDWVSLSTYTNNKIPATCCRGVTIATVGDFVSSTFCTNAGTTPKNYYEDGCYDALRTSINTYGIIAFVACGLGLFLQVLGAMAAIAVTKAAGNRVTAGHIAPRPMPPPYIGLDSSKKRYGK